MEDNIFRQQIQEDIELIKQNLPWNQNIKKDEYAFNYWVLSNLYNLDEEACHANITEYNDKGIDCFVHYKEDKELYIIQNKYYAETTRLNSKEVSDFLTRPIATLANGSYKRSPELQSIYNEAVKDDEYKIFLHFYVTNNLKRQDITNLINAQSNDSIIIDLFYLHDIREKYYGKTYSEDYTLNIDLNVKDIKDYLAISQEESDLPCMSKAYYVKARVYDIYKLWHEAEKENYPLFEENVREYLGGTSVVNKAIINTLRDQEKHAKFFYYNNGVTIICNEAKASLSKINITNPQVVNGCQTVNSIAEVLNRTGDAEKDFRDVYIMAKVLVLDKGDDKHFYRDIVRYTNSQNSINEKVFGAVLDPFFKIQEGLQKQGFLLIVKQSDKHTFKKRYESDEKASKLLALANNKSKEIFSNFKKIHDTQIPLETLIQIILAFKKDGFLAYTKKALLLKPTNQDYYQNFSTKIGDFFTIDSMIKLIVLYKKAEYDKRRSPDKKTPSPYYLLNFLGYYLESRNIDKQSFLKQINIDQLITVYEGFTQTSGRYVTTYKDKHKLEYNQIIKKEIDKKIMKDELDLHLKSMQGYNAENFEKLMQVFDNIHKD